MVLPPPPGAKMVLPPPPGRQEGSQAVVGRCPVCLVGRGLRQNPRPSAARAAHSPAGRAAVGLRHVLAEGPVAVGLRRTAQRCQPEGAVRHRADSQRHPDAGNPRSPGPRAPAACLWRRVSPVAARQSPGTVRVLQRLLPAVAGRHRVLLVAEDSLSVVPSEGAQERDGDLRASDARRGDRPSRPQGGDPPGAGAHSETRRQHQERLRAECGPTAAGRRSAASIPA